MILKGTQRANGSQLAVHLLNTADNDHVTVHEVRGFVAETLPEAFKEAFAVSRGTKCKQYLFSVSLSPPIAEQVKIDQFESAIAKIENALGLEDQPRAVVFHEKKGRRHAHCVWSRIDVQKMTAINLPHTRLKLRSVSQELYQEYKWQMPKGLKDPEQKSRFNYPRDVAQQAARSNSDAKRQKATLQECWTISDSPEAFEYALAQKGFALAQGDRRGFVLVNREGEVFSLSRWLGVKPRELESRLGDCNNYPTIEKAKELLCENSEEVVLREIRALRAKFEIDRQRLDEQVIELRRIHHDERENLVARQIERSREEADENQSLLRSGLLGLWDRVIGRDKKLRDLIAERKQAALERDRDEEHVLIQRQLGAHQYLQHQIKLLEDRTEEAVAALVDEMATQHLEQDQKVAIMQKVEFKPDYNI